MKVILTFWIFFQKWSLILKIQNGEASRLYINLLPRSWRHQKAHFQDSPSIFWSPWKAIFSSFLRRQEPKSAFEAQKFDFQKVVWNACRGSKWVPKHFLSVAHWFGTDLRLIEWIWSDFKKIENFDFLKKIFLIFKHVLCINPSENEHDFDFLNFFQKWSF